MEDFRLENYDNVTPKSRLYTYTPSEVVSLVSPLKFTEPSFDSTILYPRFKTSSMRKTMKNSVLENKDLLFRNSSGIYNHKPLNKIISLVRYSSKNLHDLFFTSFPVLPPFFLPSLFLEFLLDLFDPYPPFVVQLPSPVLPHTSP